MDSTESIVFCTNSTRYLDRLVPERFREEIRPTKAMCQFGLYDKSHVLYNIKSKTQRIVVNSNVLRKLSRIWHIIIPTIGVPELKIQFSIFPKAILPIMEDIIRNIGHLEYHKLVDPVERITAFEDHLNQPTSTLSIIQCLQNIRTEVDGAEKGPWLPLELVNAATNFLESLTDWSKTERCKTQVEKKFERLEVAKRIEQFTQDFEWFSKEKKKQKKRKLEQPRRQSSRILKRPRIC